MGLDSIKLDIERCESLYNKFVLHPRQYKDIFGVGEIILLRHIITKHLLSLRKEEERSEEEEFIKCGILDLFGEE